ncbi:MAG: hypothetical protein UV73_C0012G0153 [Candidatus Gottesmanbacteria bacterium GW2011_GWA2_43_14]|uniref:Uncharacterized protein n=1 Tax=Candidatus Gottesmanbacteria bacterium GW2011_GWA2_43_14 TaxID=1618443 RepID=A0A0G1DE28_9BACT|nr:MAG: hypothetical protein UV73_C0012G0153 [Candidatus Gottesmanbacteria bacterium GW2011_GWA2_43_14]
MNKKLREVYKNNKAIVWAGAVAVILALGVLVTVKDEVTRFTLIMPIFAGFILFAILITPDEELEDEKEVEKHSVAPKVKSKKAK